MHGSRSVIAITITILMLSAGAARAIEPIPEESGFSGYLTIGGGYSRVKSNMISGNKMSNVGNRTVGSLTDSPDSNSSGGPNINFDLRYTFASARTQLFIGNAMEDALRYDFATQLGVAQELPGNNLVAAGILYSSIPTEVWKDPYVTNLKRSRTDRTSNGFRLAWDRIFGSQLQLQYSYRDIDIDDEYSGIFLGLTPARQKLLDREGDYHEGEILYRFFFDGKHAIIPSVTYNDYNLDGDAISNDGVDFGLTYRYRHERCLLSVKGFIGYADYDKRNPIYGKTRDDDRYGIGLMGLYHNPFGWRAPFFKRTSLYVKTGYTEADSNIDFYDTEIFSAGAGLFFRF